MKTRAVVLSVLVVGALSACNEPKQAQQEAAPRPVLVASVHYEPRERAQALAGIVKARIESELAFRVGGRIDRRLVDAGAFVTKGEPLATLDESDLKLQLQEAEAEQASARSALAQAEAEEKRVTALARQGWAASADFDKVKSTADQARGAVDKAARAVSLALNALSYATLTADADGVVSAIEAEPGQVVAAGRAGRAAGAHRRERGRGRDSREPRRSRARRAGAGRILGAARRRRRQRRCANCRPTPIRRRAPTPRASACPTRRAAARLGMSVTVTLRRRGRAGRARAGRRVVRHGQGPQRLDGRSRPPATLPRRRSSSPPTTRESAYVASGVAGRRRGRRARRPQARRQAEGSRRRKPRGAVMGEFNLSHWGIRHPAAHRVPHSRRSALCGALAYSRLGRAEDPSFTIKNVDRQRRSGPARPAPEMQGQVADRIEKKLQELPWADKIETYSKPGFASISFEFRDSTPRARRADAVPAVAQEDGRREGRTCRPT